MKYRDKIFPITQGVACVNKWTWSTIWLTNGTTASCHRVLPHEVSLEDFDNFHNTPEKIEQREMMLRGEWPQKGCQICQQIEQAGGKSDRLYYSREVHGWTPKEVFEEDGIPVRVTPRLVELFINNTCNLKCIYCDPILSSSIEKENAQWGTFRNPKQHDHVLLYDRENSVIETRTEYVDAFFRWLEKNHLEVPRLHILGGEPFLQPEINRIIDFYDQHPSPECTINIISNLMVKEKNMQNYIDRFAQLVEQGKIEKLHVTGSIDAWGPGAEYVRNGMQLATFENNLRYLLQNPKANEVGIYQVVTAMGVKESVALYEKILEWRQINPALKYHFQLNTDPSKEFMHPGYWGTDLWQEDFKNLLALMAKNSDDRHAEMLGIWKDVQTLGPNEEKREVFRVYLDELDRRRGTNWRSLFPYLDI